MLSYSNHYSKEGGEGASNYVTYCLPLSDRGIILSRAEGGWSNVEVSAAMAADFGASIAESGVTDFGYSFLTTGGGVERFLALGFSKVAASALKAGDLPLTRTRSGLTDMLREER